MSSALLVALASVLLAGACGQRPDSSPNEGPPVATQDDGDISGDPNVGGDPDGSGIGNDPEWSWSPPSGPSVGDTGDVEDTGDNPDQSVTNGGATEPYKACLDMFDACQDIGGKCTKGYPGCDKHGATSCRSCYAACLRGSAYPPACKCARCGFTE